jgi:hypothetical protein
VLSMPRAAHRQLLAMAPEQRRKALAGRKVPANVAAPILSALGEGRMTLAEARWQLEAAAVSQPSRRTWPKSWRSGRR